MMYTAVILSYVHTTFQYYTWALLGILIKVPSWAKLLLVCFSEACNSEFYKFYIH